MLAINSHGSVAGVAHAILRRIESKRYWYLGNLMMMSDSAGKRVLLNLLVKMWWKWARCHRQAYAIVMNNDTRACQAAAIFKSKYFTTLKKCGRLNLYQIREELLMSVFDIFKRNGIICHGWVPNKNFRDVEAGCSEQKIPLYHLQHGPCIGESLIHKVDKNGVYMFCAWEGEKIAEDIAAINIPIGATATVFGRNMKRDNMDFILTSDI